MENKMVFWFVVRVIGITTLLIGLYVLYTGISPFFPQLWHIQWVDIPAVVTSTHEYSSTGDRYPDSCQVYYAYMVDGTSYWGKFDNPPEALAPGASIRIKYDPDTPQNSIHITKPSYNDCAFAVMGLVLTVLGFFLSGAFALLRKALRRDTSDGTEMSEKERRAHAQTVCEIKEQIQYTLRLLLWCVGRTGRAGREGRAFSFVSGKEVYKLKEIQRYCKTKIYAQKVPSLNDVANTKMENILDDVERVIEQEDLDMMINAIEERVNNSEFTAMDMAAAFLKICCGMTEDNKNTEENDWEFGDTGAGEDGMVRLFINIGKKQRVRPGDILGAIAGESGMDGKLIGTIDMYDKYTFVEVPKEYGREVLEAMKNAKIKGKSINMEPANQK